MILLTSEENAANRLSFVNRINERAVAATLNWNIDKTLIQRVGIEMRCLICVGYVVWLSGPRAFSIVKDAGSGKHS